MKLVTIILNKTECLDEILEEFGNNNLPGATIIDSRGMVQELSGHDHEDMYFLLSLRSLLSPTHKENKTIIMVAKDEDVKTISAIVNNATGGLTNPDTGILFTVPVDYAEGINTDAQ